MGCDDGVEGGGDAGEEGRRPLRPWERPFLPLPSSRLYSDKEGGDSCCVGRSQLTTYLQGKQVWRWSSVSTVVPSWQSLVTSGTPGLQNHPLWAGTWRLYFETLPAGSQVARLACGLPSRNWCAQEAEVGA